MGNKFNSQICTTREQSERLLALGLKKETADMLYLSEYSSSATMPDQTTFDVDDDEVIPAWSLHRLIEMMPKQIKKDMRRKIIDFGVLYEGKVFYEDFDFFDNLYDNIIDCIEWLIKEGYFNKEYLV